MDVAKDRLIRQRVVRGTASNYVGKVLTLGTWFLLTPFILRQLGANSYGLWVLVGSVVSYGALLDFGIAAAVTKYVAEHVARDEIGNLREVVATALAFYSGLGVLAFGLAVGIAPFFPHLFNVAPAERETARWLVIAMGATLGVSIPFTTATAVLQGLQRYDLVNLTSIGGTVLSAAAVVIILLTGGGVLAMVLVNLPVVILMQCVAVRMISRVAPDLRFGLRGANRQTARRILTFSSSLFLIAVADRLHTKTDEIVIGVALPISAVTPYALARRLSELPQMLADQFMKIMLPLSSELHANDDRERIRLLYLTGTRITLAIFLPVAAVLIVLAGPVLAAWAGPQYVEGANLVVILTLASVFATSQWPAGIILQGMERHHFLAATSLGTALANLVLSILLVRSYGVVGVALGTLIPTVLETSLLVFPYALRILGVSFRETAQHIFIPVLMPASLSIAALLAMRQIAEPSSVPAILVMGLFSTVIYVSGYLAIGASAFERRSYREIVGVLLRINRPT